jgi:hypothetical protein
MTDVHLATMSTALWVVATVSLFILLAGWSSGESWGLTASLVRGVRGWADRGGRPMPGAPPHGEPLRPILDPYAFVRRADPRAPSSSDADVEVIDLGERRLER